MLNSSLFVLFRSGLRQCGSSWQRFNHGGHNALPECLHFPNHQHRWHGTICQYVERRTHYNCNAHLADYDYRDWLHTVNGATKQLVYRSIAMPKLDFCFAGFVASFFTSFFTGFLTGFFTGFLASFVLSV